MILDGDDSDNYDDDRDSHHDYDDRDNHDADDASVDVIAQEMVNRRTVAAYISQDYILTILTYCMKLLMMMMIK